MRAGSFDRRVAILRRQLTHDGLQQVESWEIIGERWASRKPLPGGERDEGEARRSFARYSLWLRVDTLSASITSADAIGINGERFELLQPPIEIERPRDRAIELLVEGTGKGLDE